MAVLVEGISVIVRIDRLPRHLEDWEAFTATVPNKTLCYDKELVRVGFLNPDEVERFVVLLERHGLRYLVEGKACDLVVADQLRGLLMPSDWALFGRVDLEGDPRRRVGACMLAGGDPNILVAPDGWDYPGSLSESFGFIRGNGLSFGERGFDADGRETWASPLLDRQLFTTSMTRPDHTLSKDALACSEGIPLSRTWGTA